MTDDHELVELKPAKWSEEDERLLDEIIDFFENGTVKLQHDLSLYASRLKFLRKRYAWKPSDEQNVDLEKEFNSFLNDTEGVPVMWHPIEQIEWAKDIAKHFYELGLKAERGEKV